MRQIKEYDISKTYGNPKFEITTGAGAFVKGIIVHPRITSSGEEKGILLIVEEDARHEMASGTHTFSFIISGGQLPDHPVRYIGSVYLPNNFITETFHLYEYIIHNGN